MREVDSLVEEVREDHIGNGDLQMKYVLVADILIEDELKVKIKLKFYRRLSEGNLI